MRDVKSRVYFEQMKGRGTRTILPTDLRVATPSAEHKTHFVIVDAVGVCENDKTDSRPLERKRSVPFDKLVRNVALGIRDEDALTSLAGRLARLDRRLDSRDRQRIEAAAGGKPLKQLINDLLDAVDADKQIERARELFGTETPAPGQVEQATEELVKAACAPFDDPKLRNTLIEIKQRSEQIIDVVSIDDLLHAGFNAQASEKARAVVNTFRQFIEDNGDELTALQIIYSRPYGLRQVTYEQIKELAEAEARVTEALRAYAWRAGDGQHVSRRLFAEDAMQGMAFVDLLQRSFDVVLMNPPFGAASVGSKEYIKHAYPRTKNDLYSAFVERGLELLREGGYLGAITSRPVSF